ncbi:MAG: DUF1841 family protein [Deltaproteobacteria bacterium]|nr:DUF1841 family protein [Deltaproteobacteria bacterium]
MAEYNPHLQRAIFEVIDNQIEANDPPETRETFDRLLREGYSKIKARKLIGTVVVVEIYDTMKHGRPFDRERFVGNLKKLPELPFDDGE